VNGNPWGLIVWILGVILLILLIVFILDRV
jgi:uncharacterized integral membrane protein